MIFPRGLHGCYELLPIQRHCYYYDASPSWMAVHLWGKAILSMVVGRTRDARRISLIAILSSASVLFPSLSVIVAYRSLGMS
ncbi:hypothetical protein BDV37DRAFT_250991 [Aspergillus pseudonomiae]|uniref:Uncharacterized protein n=1 Tax=Aspergillus pseudonomiae TaxID=1506151 RepID=A0A5N7DB96_9EURO|nr:uncharacterized protein BDV37DRAFT_250991 [Aspergillus pseudonomiae]KAE8403048.1 hypothetical protein BDV37DRAFT_250991 [Aspergillus pseudonomiae]